MTDDERRRIEAEARTDAEWENRVKTLETDVKSIKAALIWGTRAIWGGAAYLLMKLFDFLANGGSFK
jgi:hypothetical protein